MSMRRISSSSNPPRPLAHPVNGTTTGFRRALANGEVVGRIFKANAAPVGSPWLWTLAFGHHEDRTPRRGYAATREAAMAAFAKELAAE
jgi:hypothetical protein